MGRGGWRRRRRQGRIDPARMHTPVKAIGGFGVDHIGVQNQAAERHLDMAARTAEPVIEVEVAKSGVQIVAPKQADYPPAKPDAFRVAGRPAQGMLRFGKFIDFLGFFGAVFSGVFGTLFWRSGLLIRRLDIAALSKRG